MKSVYEWVHSKLRNRIYFDIEQQVSETPLDQTSRMWKLECAAVGSDKSIRANHNGLLFSN